MVWLLASFAPLKHPVWSDFTGSFSRGMYILHCGKNLKIILSRVLRFLRQNSFQYLLCACFTSIDLVVISLEKSKKNSVETICSGSQSISYAAEICYSMLLP